MIFKQKIKDLSEDELSILLYCLNDGLSSKEDGEINMYNIYCLKPGYVFHKLNEFAPKIKPEYRSMMQTIADKVTSV
jgi:hypothetical protein